MKEKSVETDETDIKEKPTTDETDHAFRLDPIGGISATV